MKMVEKDVVLTISSDTVTNSLVESEDKATDEPFPSDITADNQNNHVEQSDEPVKQSDEPIRTEECVSSELNLLPQGDAVDVLLAAETKSDFNDELVVPTIENDDEGIEFKHENDLMACEEDLAKTELVVNEPRRNVIRRVKRRVFAGRRHVRNLLIRSLVKRSRRCLNKMHVMENVREACEIQPSSPGHAGQAPEVNEVAAKGQSGEGSPQPAEAKEQSAASEESNHDAVEMKSSPKVVENGSPNCEELIEKENEPENGVGSQNEDTFSNDSGENVGKGGKRKFEGEEVGSVKKIKSDIQESFLLRDKILNECIELGDCSSLEQVHSYTEQVIAEIKTLNDLAREKEREWNNIIHLKKLKEELLLRLQRRKQLFYLNSDKNDINDVDSTEFDVDDRLKNNTQSILKSNLTNPKNSSLRLTNKLTRNPITSTNQEQYEQKQRQRNVLDVQSIIADYRQRHPETVPRRGRRIRSNNQNDKSNSNVLNFSSMALGSGSQMRQNNQEVNSELSMLLNAMDNSKGSDQTTQETSFRDMLVQIAKMSQSERHELFNAVKPPPPYPEVTVHPVVSPTVTTQSNSLLHGILTKPPAKASSKTSFSPTLARLLTAPERSAANSHLGHSNAADVHPTDNVSITDILSTSKARNEITITPVGQFDNISKDKVNKQEDEEVDDIADRLVIDEACEPIDGRGRADNGSEAGDEVPQCQGCNQSPAQFVCAGCGNQWYCSRDCQVNAWDEHSEVCSG